MSIKSGFAFGHGNADRNNAPSSGDGGPGYDAAGPSSRLSTAGGLGNEEAHGDLAAYREAARAFSHGEHDQGATGLSVPTAADAFCTEGQIPADTADQIATTTGGADRLLTRQGGSDCDLDNYDSGASGGRVVG